MNRRKTTILAVVMLCIAGSLVYLFAQPRKVVIPNGLEWIDMGEVVKEEKMAGFMEQTVILTTTPDQSVFVDNALFDVGDRVWISEDERFLYVRGRKADGALVYSKIEKEVPNQ